MKKKEPENKLYTYKALDANGVSETFVAERYELDGFTTHFYIEGREVGYFQDAISIKELTEFD